MKISPNTYNIIISLAKPLGNANHSFIAAGQREHNNDLFLWVTVCQNGMLVQAVKYTAINAQRCQLERRQLCDRIGYTGTIKLNLLRCADALHDFQHSLLVEPQRGIVDGVFIESWENPQYIVIVGVAGDRHFIQHQIQVMGNGLFLFYLPLKFPVGRNSHFLTQPCHGSLAGVGDLCQFGGGQRTNVGRSMDDVVGNRFFRRGKVFLCLKLFQQHKTAPFQMVCSIVPYRTERNYKNSA